MFSTPEQKRRTRQPSTPSSIMRQTPPPSPGTLYQRPESALIIPTSSHISNHSTHSALTTGSGGVLVDDQDDHQNQNHHHRGHNEDETSQLQVRRPPPPPPPTLEVPIGSENTMDRTNNSSGRRRHHGPKPPPRLIERNMAFGQSANEVSIRHKRNIGLKKWLLLKNDWFHVLLRVNTLTSLFGLLSVWTTIVLIFCGVYMVVDRTYVGTDCGLGQEDLYISFGAAFAFSLETATTVGYGLPGSTNAFFENCPSLQGVIYSQMVFAMMFNAFLFAFFFARLGKCEARGVQVVFSKKCLLTKNELGKWCLKLRVHDADARYPIVEAHVRLYVKTKYSQELIPLRVGNPDDDMGAVCWVSYPTTIEHEIDMYSPLHPNNSGRIKAPLSPFHLPQESISQYRQADGRCGTLDQAVCNICGETFGTFDRLKKHVKYNQWCERRELDGDDDCNNSTGRPPLHVDVNVEDIPSDDDMPTKEELVLNFPLEIVVLLEGIESLVSGTFQALQSYTRDDLIVGGRFAECVSIEPIKPFTKKNRSRRNKCWLWFWRRGRGHRHHHYSEQSKETHVVDLLKFNQVLVDDEEYIDFSCSGEDESEEMVHPETASCRQM